MRISDWSSDVCSSDLQGAPEDPTLKKTGDSVTEPFDGKEVPDKLLAIQADPYSLAGLRRCAAIIREVEELDAVLGPDVNERVDKRDRKSTRLNSSNYCASRMPLFAGKKKNEYR